MENLKLYRAIFDEDDLAVISDALIARMENINEARARLPFYANNSEHITMAIRRLKYMNDYITGLQPDDEI